MNGGVTLGELKSSYSAALYSFFRVTNLKQSYKKFTTDPTKPPVFKYSGNLSLSSVNYRISTLRAILKKLDSAQQAETAFVEWRLSESFILREFSRIYNQHGKPTPEMVDKYLADQQELYGAIDTTIFGGIMHYVRVRSHRRGEDYIRIMDQIDRKVNGYHESHLFTPKELTFTHYKKFFAESFPELHKVMSSIRRAEEYSIGEVVHIFEQALVAVGADKKGWTVTLADGGANIIAAKYSKKIIVGSDFHPTSSLRFKQIVAHEVGCHVQKAITDRQANTYAEFDENDEGLAILLEQLLATRFAHKRALRYLAICLAMGVDGQKRDFCEVHDILWRISYIIGGIDKPKAKEQAFYETTRAFRGGIASVPGMVYIKDKIYLESNLFVWEKLETKMLVQDEFRRLFRGLK